MASVGRYLILLVLLLWASTEPGLTSAQPWIGRPNVPRITYTSYHFHPILRLQGRELVIAAAVALYNFNAVQNPYLRWPRIYSIVPMRAAVAAGVGVFMMSQQRPFFIYRAKVCAGVAAAGMYGGNGRVLRWVFIDIYFAVWAGQPPLAQNAIPGSISTKISE
ncbi:hypothetical protein AXF42_Ash007813 [Apostasia shenzhenica]|uniref:Uncharacterized protein n=1 Tax=Apostasia shenzhenica TaxID=1088818 RepID=A0A2I0B5E7_9ASPA|nr:hypothetical protein AXF42_Ash007813 [Apostasia shenzhenica]